MNVMVKADLIRLMGKADYKTFIKAFYKNKCFRHLFFYRKCKEKNSKLVKSIYRVCFHYAYKSSGIELPLSAEIGGGMLVLHPTGVTINSNAKIGKNFTILKGATIGNTKRGKTAGTPIIGDNVYVGLNSTIVGGINIGNDVLVAANTFVNFDVPSHSVVIGSPGVIHRKENAVEGYIENCWTDEVL